MRYKHIFAIGDIHGCAHELDLLLQKLPLGKDTLVVFLGDYIDRGPHSKEVIDRIFELKKSVPLVGIRGNHEKMLLDFLDNKTTPDAAAFIFNGGGATLASYADEFGQYSIPPLHEKFYRSLLPYYETEDYLFVHAGLPDVSIKELKNPRYYETMMWVRDEFFESDFEWEKFIVHGHTPLRGSPDRTEKRINIDTSCVYGGSLTALQLPEFKIYEVKKAEPSEYRFLKEKNSQRRSVRYVGDIPVNLYKEGCPYRFQTVNYSEIGMLIYDPLGEELVFKAGEIVHGDIMVREADIIAFSASIVRSEAKATGVFYALQFQNPPCGLEVK